MLERKLPLIGSADNTDNILDKNFSMKQLAIERMVANDPSLPVFSHECITF